MFQKLPKFLKVAEKTASCPKVAEQLVDRAIGESDTQGCLLADFSNFPVFYLAAGKPV